MGQLSTFFIFVALLFTLPTGAQASEPEHSDDSFYESKQNTRVLGRNLGASISTGTPAGSTSLQSNTVLTILGDSLHALTGNIDIPNTPDAGSTQGIMEFYSFGKRVFSESFFESHTGILGGEIGLAPSQVTVPIVSYPVGPLLLEIDGGVRFQADLQGHINPTIIMGPGGISNRSTITATLLGNALGAGFLEGYAKLFVVRGGLEGQLDLINADATASSTFFFDGGQPLTQISAMAQFLSGDISAFLDYFNIFEWSWSNLWTDTLYRWNGVCYSTGSMKCP